MMNIKTTLRAFVLAFLLPFALAGCELLDDVADDRLGVVCGDDSRVARAAMLTDMIDRHYGDELPAAVSKLRQKVDLMHRAVVAGDGLDAAGDSYKGDFVGFAVKLFAKRGASVAINGFDDAIDRMRKLPELVADINEIEAKVKISCAERRAMLVRRSDTWRQFAAREWA